MSFKIPCGGFMLGEGLVLSEDGKTLSVSGGGGGVQPDWNQNDSTASDYIKNRPFYSETTETVLVEEITVPFTSPNGAGIYYATIQSAFKPTAGETYKVSWDGAAYECVGETISGYTVIGNPSVISMGADTGEPFIITQLVDNSGIEIDTKDTSASHTISISRSIAEVVKIDEKYLPTIPAPIYIIKEDSVFSSSITFEEAWKLPPNILASRLNLTLDASSAESWKGMSCREVDKEETEILGKCIVATFSALSVGNDHIYNTTNYAIVWNVDGITQLTPKEGA